MSKKSFIEKIAPLVQAENKKRGYPLFSSVVIAQAICETGWGSSIRMMKSNAIFGIKAGSNWRGKVYSSRTQECYDGKKYTNINACFRAYNSLQDSISDYFDLICKNSRYRKAITTKTPYDCISAIKKGGYATSPNYIVTIMSIIEDNKLTKYDVTSDVRDISYKVGQVYTLQVDLKVRVKAGTNQKIKDYKDLTDDAKKHAIKQEKAILKKGTKVTCLDVVHKKSEIWLKIPSGYIAGFYNEKYYVK